jgi:hypothetical protein
MRGNANRFGEDVDRGILLQVFKAREIWVVEGGDLRIFVFLVAQQWWMNFLRMSNLTR